MRGGVLALTVLAVDQLVKALVLAQLEAYRPIEVTPFFNLVLVWNKGVSFGMLAEAGQQGPWLLMLLTAAIGGFLLVWLWRETRPLTRAARGWCSPGPPATPSTGCASVRWSIFSTSMPSAITGRPSTWRTAPS